MANLLRDTDAPLLPPLSPLRRCFNDCARTGCGIPFRTVNPLVFEFFHGEIGGREREKERKIYFHDEILDSIDAVE